MTIKQLEMIQAQLNSFSFMLPKLYPGWDKKLENDLVETKEIVANEIKKQKRTRLVRQYARLHNISQKRARELVNESIEKSLADVNDDYNK